MNIISIPPQIMWDSDLFLRKPSRELEKTEVLSDDFQKILKNMFQSLYENPIGVGLSAPQVGLQIRLAVIDIKRNGKKPYVLINPFIVPIGDETVDSIETCLSFPNFAGKVLRYKKIKVFAKNIKFEDIEFEAESFFATVCQHEIDHLNGIVYIDKAEKVFNPQNRYEIMSDSALKTLLQE